MANDESTLGISVNKMNEYRQERSETDINLVNELCLLFTRYNHGNKIPIFLKHKLIQEANVKVPTVQRHLLNRYFNTQLSFCNNTQLARYNLLANGDINDWLVSFEKGVLPAILDNELPIDVT